MYTNSSRVLHLGNVANTGENLVRYARSQGRAWALRTLPAAPSLKSASAWVERGSDALKYSLGHTRPDLVHVHYGPNGYYGDLKRAPFVLHLHGTDLREDLHKPILGELERHSLKRAAKVVVATPDLLEAARALRNDALYVPNPVPLEALRAGEPKTKPQAGRVVFSARWEDSKGGPALVDAARNLVNEGAEVVGVNWGTYTDDARAAGVNLVDRMPPETFRRFLSSGEVVVGQTSFGVLGISDMEAMASGRPLVTSVDDSLEGAAPVKKTTGETLAQDVLDLLSNHGDRESLGVEGRDWVMTERHPQATLELLEGLYSEILA